MRLATSCLALLASLGLAQQALAQSDEGPDAGSVYTGPFPAAAVTLGNVLGDVPVTFDTGIIGIEHDGSGNLLYTSTSTDNVGRMDTSGNFIEVLFTANQGSGTNPIGVTSDGNQFYVTDTTDDEVEIYSAAGAPVGTFSVAALTPFPEGITYSTLSNRLIVVDGAFSTNPPDSLIQYETNGNFISQTNLATLSNDGAAYDPQRCSVWVYESGGDSITQFNEFNLATVTTFAGTTTAGHGTGEGVAVIGNILYVLASGADRLVSFDITEAPSVCPSVEVPTLNITGLAALLALLAGGGFWGFHRRRNT